MANDSENGQSNTTTSLNSTQGGINNTTIAGERFRSRRNCEVPKLRSVKCDDYAKWRIGITCWARLTKMERGNQAPHVILNCIVDPEVYDVAISMRQEVAEADNGIQNVLEVLDDYFKPNTFIRKLGLWHQFRKCEKTESIIWHTYKKRMEKLRSDLIGQGLIINDELYCLALIDASKLDANQEMNKENSAKNANSAHVLTVNDTEEALLRKKGLEHQYEESKVLVMSEQKTDEEENAEINWIKTGFREKKRHSTRRQISWTKKKRKTLRWQKFEKKICMLQLR